MTLSGAAGADEIPSEPAGATKTEEGAAPAPAIEAAVDVPMPAERPPSIKDRVVTRSHHEICSTVAESAHSNDLPLPFFIRLLFQESGFKPDVVSRAGAQGIAQFMPETAATVGLSNPFDPIQAITASARLLGDLVRRFGNPGLAARCLQCRAAAHPGLAQQEGQASRRNEALCENNYRESDGNLERPCEGQARGCAATRSAVPGESYGCCCDRGRTIGSPEGRRS